MALMMARKHHHFFSEREITVIINRVCNQTKILANLYTTDKMATTAIASHATFSHAHPFNPDWNDNCISIHPKEFIIYFLKTYNARYHIVVSDELVFAILHLFISACKIMTGSMNIAVSQKNMNRVAFTSCVLAIKWIEDEVPNMNNFLTCSPLNFKVAVFSKTMASSLELFMYVHIFKCSVPFFIILPKTNPPFAHIPV
jgi:hypothetical protein